MVPLLSWYTAEFDDKDGPCLREKFLEIWDPLDLLREFAVISEVETTQTDFLEFSTSNVGSSRIQLRHVFIFFSTKGGVSKPTSFHESEVEKHRNSSGGATMGI